MAQTLYSSQGQAAMYRQSAGHLQGKWCVYMLAIWADGAFSYSLGLSHGVPEMGWLDELANVLCPNRRTRPCREWREGLGWRGQESNNSRFSRFLCGRPTQLSVCRVCLSSERKT